MYEPVEACLGECECSSILVIQTCIRYTLQGHPPCGGVFSPSSTVYVYMQTCSPQLTVLIVIFWTHTAEDDLDATFRGATGLFDEQVLLKASDPRAVLVPSVSGHNRSTQGALLSPSTRVCPTPPS